MLLKQIILWYASLYDFHIWDCPNLRNQFNKWKVYQGIRTVERFEFQNTRSDIKKYCDHWEKRKIYQANQIYKSEAFTYKSYPDTDFADEQVVQYDIPVVVNTLVGDCK